jgi:hypothetical protein
LILLLIDTNVQLDLTSNNRKWSDWSLAKLKLAATRGPLLINDVVYAELSVGFGRIEDLDRFPRRYTGQICTNATSGPASSCQDHSAVP